MEESVKTILHEDLKIQPAVVTAEFDKAHRVGPSYHDKKDNLQHDVIVRFKSHSFKEMIYSKRKQQDKVKLRVSLTSKRKNLLDYANATTESIDEIDFVFADQNGNLKVKSKEKISNKLFMSFSDSLCRTSSVKCKPAVGAATAPSVFE